MRPELDRILKETFEKKASDLHLKVGLVPVIRQNGRLRPLGKHWSPLSVQDLKGFSQALLRTPEEKTRFKHYKEIDLGYGVKGVGRFRINLFLQRGSFRIVARAISDTVPTLSELKLPEIVKEIALLERGLVLVTGVTGSGKSSTLAAMINRINKKKSRHIVTLEDPIEFLIRDHRSLISQREVGFDTTNFSTALRAALRQDPDVILIGEMRDKETIETALMAAETGHLVLSTLHTSNARESVNRILSVFDSHQQQQVRRQLAANLQAVISQRLALTKEGKGRLPVVEIMVANARIREMIHNPEKTRLITNAIETSAKDTGMISFDQCLHQLLKQDKITLKEALKLSENPDDFLLKQKGVTSGTKTTSSVKKTKKVTATSESALPSFPHFRLEDEETEITPKSIKPMNKKKQ